MLSQNEHSHLDSQTTFIPPDKKSTVESLRKQHRVLFFAGMNMEQHSNEPIEAMLEKSLEDLGKGKVTTYTSVFSSEVMKSQRYIQMQNDLKEALESG